MNTQVAAVDRESGELRRLAAQAVDTAEGGVPTRVLLAPWGEVTSANGDFVVDEEAGELIGEAFERQGTDIPIDYEHQTLGGSYSSPSGRAPAAGWIKRLQVVPGEGLVATVEWTTTAEGQLAAKEYRYVSPVVMVRSRDRRVIGLHSAALTNKPAIEGMPPIVNQMPDPLFENDAVEALRCRVESPAAADVSQLLTAACRRIDELSERLQEKEAQERVRLAMRAGKLTGAQKDWALRLARHSPEQFTEWEATAPVVVPMGATKPPTTMDRSESEIARAARQEYRSHPELARFTDEQAYVRDALRSAR